MQNIDAMGVPDVKEIEEVTSRLLRNLRTKEDPNFGLKWIG